MQHEVENLLRAIDDQVTLVNQIGRREKWHNGCYYAAIAKRAERYYRNGEFLRYAQSMVRLNNKRLKGILERKGDVADS